MKKSMNNSTMNIEVFVSVLENKEVEKNALSEIKTILDQRN